MSQDQPQKAIDTINASRTREDVRKDQQQPPAKAVLTTNAPRFRVSKVDFPEYIHECQRHVEIERSQGSRPLE